MGDLEDRLFVAGELLERPCAFGAERVASLECRGATLDDVLASDSTALVQLKVGGTSPTPSDTQSHRVVRGRSLQQLNAESASAVVAPGGAEGDRQADERQKRRRI